MRDACYFLPLLTKNRSLISAVMGDEDDDSFIKSLYLGAEVCSYITTRAYVLRSRLSRASLLVSRVSLRSRILDNGLYPIIVRTSSK